LGALRGGVEVRVLPILGKPLSVRSETSNGEWMDSRSTADGEFA
jgi:hypothetical protein